jgi:hypothetical protein
MSNIFETTLVLGFAVGVLAAGCTRKSESKDPPPPPFQRNEASLAGMVKQERTKIQNDFENLKTYYWDYEITMGKPPAKWEDFKPYIVRDGPASLVSGIENGRYVVVWKAKPSSKNVLAYEKQPDVNGKQIVLFGDRIETIASEDLKKALEGQK